MEKEKKKALEQAGFRVGDAAEFLGLSDEERRLIELRVVVGRELRRLREKRRLTQQQLADRLKSSQSRVAKMEAASSDVSLDLLMRGLFAVGGDLKLGSSSFVKAKPTRSPTKRKSAPSKNRLLTK